jgi:succinate dehydrogenase (ubiquinone) cytochrome b560 subunit
MPTLVSGGVKFLLAFPFTYHFANGLRHLVWDLGKGFTKPVLTKTEAATWIVSVLSSLFLAFGL